MRLPVRDLGALRRMPAVEVVELAAGEWVPPRREPWRGHLGYLLVDGLMVRELRAGEGASVELLDCGDLLQPWVEDAASFVSADWQVVERARLIALDARAVDEGNWRRVAEDLLDRAMRRSRSMAVQAAIASSRRIQDRLLLLLWHVAERRGRRVRDGVEVRFPATHETLAHLVAARRPSVTTALQRLQRKRLLTRSSTGEWTLHGDPPTDQG